MKEKSESNLLFFEGSSMRILHQRMIQWQKKHQKRFLSACVQKEGDSFSCIAVTNPMEVVICGGSSLYGQAQVVGGCLNVTS